jgi:hypothetical protein
MYRLIALAFAASIIAAPAIAMPSSVASTGTDVIQVAGGCGPGFHRGPFNGCRQNYANPGAHPCPRGFHIGPRGACRGNGR